MDYLEELYEKVIEDSTHMEVATAKVEDEIKSIMIASEKIIPYEQNEIFRDYLFRVANVTSKEAFIAGYCYAITLFTESLIKNIK